MPRRQAAPPAAGWTGFAPAALTFLRQVRRHNTREWFEANRERYHRLIRDPMRAFVEEFDVLLATELPEVMGDPRRSVFRIHRDVRFSADKSPYKTHAACWFYHRDAGAGVGQAAHGGAGLYVHLEPGASMIAAGIWMPPKPALDQLRAALLEDHQAFEAIVTAPAFRRRYGALSEEAMLVRAPRGTDPDHPAARWLRYKSFTVHRMLDNAAITDPRLITRLARDVAALRPLVRWCNGALGLEPLANRR